MNPLSYHASATFVAIVDALAKHAEIKYTLREGHGIEQKVTDDELRKNVENVVSTFDRALSTLSSIDEEAALLPAGVTKESYYLIAACLATVSSKDEKIEIVLKEGLSQVNQKAIEILSSKESSFRRNSKVSK